MKLTNDPSVKAVFDNYPKSVKTHLLKLRKMVLKTASKIDGPYELKKTLNWGEPS